MKFARRSALVVAGVAVASTVNTGVVAPPAEAALSYGAIAYAPNGAVGAASNFSSRREAEQTAMDWCGWSDCKVLVTFTGCGAVAENDVKFQGGNGPILVLAEGDALSRIGSGWIDSWVCN
ncbi:DUF4189 domain-containing protein [Mycolicibacterium sp. P1-18]|uniref:DUF4189 domain-containing protein n=1 Tax=Mycolicibacterium sp. P1-18 TaxID=2024615 RepID=UPI0011F32064|nr:DUF4189 domain-containing protein [Mycolicibacterium sp. P1-18]KAA0093662.1 DUF4189 domain-containing protein [Mycolicibacterium sp. P1-18]